MWSQLVQEQLENGVDEEEEEEVKLRTKLFEVIQC